jgi:hypothetical protein
MTALERELAAVRLDLPPAPDVSAAVLARVRRVRTRRRTWIAVVAAAVAVAAAFAVPTARTSILRWVGLGGVTIERVPSLHATSLRTAASFGTPVGRVDGLDFGVRLPRLEGLPPRHLYLDRDAPSPILTAVYGDPDRPAIVLSEWRGNVAPHFHKLVRY